MYICGPVREVSAKSRCRSEISRDTGPTVSIGIASVSGSQDRLHYVRLPRSLSVHPMRLHGPFGSRVVARVDFRNNLSADGLR